RTLAAGIPSMKKQRIRLRMTRVNGKLYGPYITVSNERKRPNLRSWKPTPKNLARLELRTAVKKGRLTKPDRCDACKLETPARKLHGHHQNYMNPLAVEWLCQKCHLLRHPQ